MLVRSKNNSDEEKDILAIGQTEYTETNPFGYKDYKETFDNIHWWKTVEYTDENGEKVKKEINPFGQVMICRNVMCRENTNKKKEINLDDALLDDLDFDDNQQETKNEQRYDWEDTPDSEPDGNNLSENDFYGMEWRTQQYLIYRLLLNISSSLSDIKEVLSDGNKTE